MPNPSPLAVLLLLAASVSGAVNTTDSQELSSALDALRHHGYTLFTNAITTSDLQFQLLTTPSAAALAPFTLFAPKDDMLFALDMATDAAVYVNTLRYHIVSHNRYTLADLQNLSSPYLDTLLPHYSILVGKVLDGDVLSDDTVTSLMVDGVRVSVPDLFLGSRIVVHGIDGILLSGLSITQDPDAVANRSTAESPAPVGPDLNIPAEEMFQFDRNKAPPATPLVGDVPPEGIRTPTSGLNRNKLPPSEENIPPSQVSRGKIPVAPASTNIPADGSVNSPGGNIPVATNIPADGSLNAPGGNIPVTKSPKIIEDQMKKLKSLAKKREKQLRKGRRRHHHHRKHTPTNDL